MDDTALVYRTQRSLAREGASPAIQKSLPSEGTSQGPLPGLQVNGWALWLCLEPGFQGGRPGGEMNLEAKTRE